MYLGRRSSSKKVYHSSMSTNSTFVHHGILITID